VQPSVWKGLSSRVFLVLVLLLSLGLFYAAELVDEKNHAALYGTLSHLAAMLLAAFIAAAFFSFRDVRELLSASITSLLVDGRFAEHLSPSLRGRLRRLLLLQDLGDRVAFLEPEVLELVERIQQNALALPHHYGHSTTVTLSDHTDNPAHLRRHVRTSSKVSCRHCKGSRGNYRLIISAEITNLGGAMPVDDFLRTFSVRAGSQMFGPSDATVSKQQSAGTDIVHIALDKEILVENELEISYEYETICSKTDPTEIQLVRYPTAGFRFTVVYRDGIDYDVAWFRATESGPRGALPTSRETVELTPRGITAFTHKWLLPGDGVALIWFPKPPSTAAS